MPDNDKPPNNPFPDIEQYGGGDGSGPDDQAQAEKAELFPNENQLNIRAYRAMRWWAFAIAGGISAIYLIVLLCVLKELMSVESLAVIGNASTGWHFLVFAAAISAVFAAVPMSISMALFRMISDKPDEKKVFLKTPQIEGLMMLLDFIRGKH